MPLKILINIELLDSRECLQALQLGFNVRVFRPFRGVGNAFVVQHQPGLPYVWTPASTTSFGWNIA